MGYTLKSGKLLTDADLCAISEAIEVGDLQTLGKPGEIAVGRPRLSSEPLVAMTFKIPQTDATKIKRACELEGVTRSDFLRRASVSMADEVLA